MSQSIAARGTELQRSPDGTTYTTVAEVLKIGRSGSKADLADVTNMDSPSSFREFLPTLLDSGEISFECNLIPASSIQATVLSDFTGQVLSYWKIELPATAGHWAFQAYVTSDDLDFPIDKQVTKTVKLKITGPVTYTAGS
jgi:Lambda phage tail tube protein, TTP